MLSGHRCRVNRFAFAHGVSFQFEFVGVVHESVEDGLGDRAVAEGGVPLVERELTGDEGGASVVAVIQDFEKIAHDGIGEWCEAEVV